MRVRRRKAPTRTDSARSGVFPGHFYSKLPLENGKCKDSLTSVYGSVGTYLMHFLFFSKVRLCEIIETDRRHQYLRSAVKFLLCRDHEMIYIKKYVFQQYFELPVSATVKIIYL